MSNSENVIFMDPWPRKIDVIFTPEDKRRLDSLGRVIWPLDERVRDDHIDRYLPQTVALIGQTAMPRERLNAAPHLRAIFNVEGNFQPNIDYTECHRRNIHVLSCAPVFAPAVAEMALGLALASVRGIVSTDIAFRQGNETYGGASNQDCFLLRGKVLGLIGCGNVGRSLLPLLRPFGAELLVHDPWLHPGVLQELGVQPSGVEDVFRRSDVVFILAAATEKNRGALGASYFQMMRRGSAVVLVSRADVVNFDDLLHAAERGHIRAAVDVFPEEPLPANAPVRRVPNIILSAHRAGGLPETYRQIGTVVVDDLELILRGLPPQRMQRALIETVTQYRSKAVRQT